MADGVEVLQDVIVFDVAVAGVVVLVDVYGSVSNVCGSVRFVIPEPELRAQAVEQIERWCRQITPLSLIMSGPAVALQNDHDVFGAQLIH